MRILELMVEGHGAAFLLEWARLGLAITPGTLLIVIGIAWGWARQREAGAAYRKFAKHLVLTQFLIAAAMLLAYGLGATDPLSGKLVSLGSTLGEFSLDGVSLLMLTMVSGVGWVAAGFTENYLSGDHRQTRFFGWLAFAIGSVSLMSISGNLLQFMIFWFASSLGMHFLLQHFERRAGASYGAWSKFWISRVGDLFLLLALRAYWELGGTWNFHQLATLAQANVASPVLSLAGVLLAMGCIIKSVQFPFHFWLAETLESPTPVSAFMHAGIVNAGGFLIIRMSPVLVHSSLSLNLLFVVGLVTLIFGSVVMLTQTSIKSQLVYSTVAQMGFMMLQCGAGGFAAALLHLVGHSVYKSHAFLSSGSVISERRMLRSAPGSLTPRYGWFAASSAGFVVLFFVVLWSLNLGVDKKPGSLVLGFAYCSAMVLWLYAGLRQSAKIRWRATAISVGLLFLYCGSYLIVSRLSSGLIAEHWVGAESIWRPIVAVMGLSIVALVSLLVAMERKPKWLQAFRVHASNGFYVEDWVRRRWQLLSYES